MRERTAIDWSSTTRLSEPSERRKMKGKGFDELFARVDRPVCWTCRYLSVEQPKHPPRRNLNKQFYFLEVAITS